MKIILDLCRQCYDKAESTEADFVTLRCIEHKPYPKCSPPFDPMLPEVHRNVVPLKIIMTLSVYDYKCLIYPNMEFSRRGFTKWTWKKSANSLVVCRSRRTACVFLRR